MPEQIPINSREHKIMSRNLKNFEMLLALLCQGNIENMTDIATNLLFKLLYENVKPERREAALNSLSDQARGFFAMNDEMNNPQPLEGIDFE